MYVLHGSTKGELFSGFSQYDRYSIQKTSSNIMKQEG